MTTKRRRSTRNQTNKALVTRKDALLNYYFRYGDMAYMSDKDEYDILAEHVASKRKPVASMVVEWPLEDDCEQLGLKTVSGVNDRGVHILVLTAQPGATLMELLLQRERIEQKLVAHHMRYDELLDRKVSRYVSDRGVGFDISNKTTEVNVLEFALLLGYPLEGAGSAPSLSWPVW